MTVRDRLLRDIAAFLRRADREAAVVVDFDSLDDEWQKLRRRVDRAEAEIKAEAKRSAN